MSARGDLLELPKFAEAFDAWLSSEPEELVAARQPMPVFEDRVRVVTRLMGALFDAGWTRFGWPEELGGMGGTIRHRAVVWEALARHGLPSMTVFEHLEVLGPTLVQWGPPAFVADALPAFLSGRERWCQGFSEPDAGSDLAALRTRARAVDDGFRITGRKIWTSWARYADRCLVLARTGTTESRHRGITAFIVDMDDPGVEVRPLVQANGTDELAEVAFDDVVVPAGRVVGTVDGGWKVAMHILSAERGTFAWFRHGFLRAYLEAHLDQGDGGTDRELGHAYVDLVVAAAAGADGVSSHEAGVPLGPRATFTKLFLCNAEQAVADWVLAADGDLAVGVQDDETAMTRQEYLFSRIVTVYGGSQQMQLETIAKQILGLP